MPDRQDIAVAEEQDLGQNLHEQTDQVSWEPSRDLSWEEWSSITRTLQTVGKALPFWLGDALVWGERHFGEAYTQILEETDYSRETCKKFRAVAARIPKARRRPGVSWSTHFAVCYIEPAAADKILRIAEEFSLSVREVKMIAAMPNRQAFFDFIDNAIQLRYPEVMAEAKRITDASYPQGNDAEAPQNDAGGARNGDNDESGSAYDDGGETGLAWLDGTGNDPVDQFFAEKGVPILFSDSTQVVWQGGIRLYVQRDGNDTHLVWERRL